MPQKCKTPAGTGASRDSLAGLSRPCFSLQAYQAQILMAAHGVRPEWAAMLAALAFGGPGHAG
jgi:hypothetical protein